MRAILLAAGYGTRLRPLTNTIPKCLVPIKGQPLLEIWLENLTRAGIGPFLINTHYMAEQVVEYIESSPYQDLVTLVHEPELRGTAGTLIDNLEFFGREDGLLVHADNYCMPDFRAFVRAHQERPTECLMTMMTFRSEDPSSCGIVELDDKGVVVRFHEKVKLPPGNLANGAIYILSPELLERMYEELRGVNDFSNQVLHRFVGRIYNYETAGIFVDVGTPAAYAAANRH